MASPPSPSRRATGTGQPGPAEALYLQAKHHHQQGQLDQALALYNQVRQRDPRHLKALLMSGVIAGQREDYPLALQLIEQALALDPTSAMAWYNGAKALIALKRYREAQSYLDRALTLRPAYEMALHNRAVSRWHLEDLPGALADCDATLALNPHNVEALALRGTVHLKRLDLDQAERDCLRALSLQPDHAESHSTLGYVYLRTRSPADALRRFDHALTCNPRLTAALIGKGQALVKLQRQEEALACYGQALRLSPDTPEAYFNRGLLLRDGNQLESALADFSQAALLKPEAGDAVVFMLATQLALANWHGLDARLAAMTTMIRQDAAGPVSLLPLLWLTDDPDLHRISAERAAREHPPHPGTPPPPCRAPRARLRVGYFSGDFRNHAVSYLACGLFEHHDRDRFEIIAFSNKNQQDAMRERLTRAFDRFIDIADTSAAEAERLVREQEIDIAVDLSGYTAGNRLDLFARRIAPIQVNYLGYPGTLGAPYMDYILADPTLIPPASRVHYREKIAYLPHSYQVNDRDRRLGDHLPTRGEQGLPATGFVFCCFNHVAKILPPIFGCWMRLLAALPSSSLWLLEPHPTAIRHLRREAERQGVAGERLIFAPLLPLEEHLARLRLADLFLDTLPYNAHTSASDALWAGVPVLTCMGQSFASRVGASLLRAIDLPELVTPNLAAYETLAQELATDPARLGALRDRLGQNRLTTPLFDTHLRARHIEAAFLAMVERQRQGLAPDHLFVTP